MLRRILIRAFQWLRKSNRWKHLAGGVCIGAFSNGFYCTIYTGSFAAAALEFKDRTWGGKWDWVDFALTLAGAILGFGIRKITDI